LGFKVLHDTEHLHNDWPMIEEYPLSKKLLALSHVWTNSEENHFVVSAKGAPESITDLCHLDENEKKIISDKVNILADSGLRVLGVAKSIFKKEVLPESQHDFDFKFVGLIGLSDPIRETVPQAIKECYEAGIRVVMITGDYPSTAINIAGQIGLKNPNEVITGADIEKMDASELAERIKSVNIFARVVPEQKLLLVNAFKSNNEIVAMTGDGVNDAPALKSAHIGVAMGERGTDVARESSAIVLVKDDFNSIVAAVRMGRRIFDNLRKAMAYIISVHIPIAGASLLPVIFNWPVILHPLHVVFMELIIDPACSIVFEQEKEETNIMKRSPRKTDEPMFGTKLMLFSFFQGLCALFFVILAYRVSMNLGQTQNDSRTIAFITLIITNLGLILSNRYWSKNIINAFRIKNSALIFVIIGAMLFLALVTYVPFLQKMFYFNFMHLSDLAIAFSAGISSIVCFELIKFIMNRKMIK
jgi:Ca2+-transporting ATPase